MRHAAVLFGALVLAACGTAPVPRSDSEAVSPVVVEFLLTSAATDFHARRPPDPARFRNLRIGHVKTPSGGAQYMLCGQFLPALDAGHAEWTAFVTIKTSGYEQYLGAQAATSYCQGPSVVWDTEGDLATALQRRFDSLR